MTTDIQTYQTSTELYTPSNYSSFSGAASAASAEVRKLVVNAANAAESLADHEGETLQVIGVFTRPGVRRTRVQGAPDMPCTNTTIVCADGKGYFSQSEGVRQAVDTFMAAGLFDAGEVVPMQLVSRKLPNGNTRKTLILV